DIVEIITSSNQRPSKDWLNFVTTSKARNKIRSYLRNEQRDSSRKLGRDLLAQELQKRDQDLDKVIHNEKIEPLIRSAKEGNLDDLYVAIGYGRVNAKELVHKFFPDASPKKSSLEEVLPPKASVVDSNAQRSSKSSILVSG